MQAKCIHLHSVVYFSTCFKISDGYDAEKSLQVFVSSRAARFVRVWLLFVEATSDSIGIHYFTYVYNNNIYRTKKKNKINGVFTWHLYVCTESKSIISLNGKWFPATNEISAIYIFPLHESIDRDAQGAREGETDHIYKYLIHCSHPSTFFLCTFMNMQINCNFSNCIYHSFFSGWK